MQEEVLHSDEGSEESYFVSMTDIMVGMVFVFIILLMYFVFQIQDPSEQRVPLSVHKQVIDERDAHFRNLEWANRRITELEAEIDKLRKNALDQYMAAADRDRRAILLSLQKSMEEAGITVEVIPDQGVLRLPEQLLFGKNQSKILPGGPEDAVKALAKALFNVLSCFTIGPEHRASIRCNPNGSFVDAVLFEGHTDNDPIKTPLENGRISDNLELSAQRAINAVRLAYKSEPRLNGLHSISPSQRDLSIGQGSSPVVNAAAFGDTRPAFPNDEDGKKGNRRIDLRLLMFSPRTESLDVVRKLLAP